MIDPIKIYLEKKVCYVCKAAQSANRTSCYKKHCNGPLRARRKSKNS